MGNDNEIKAKDLLDLLPVKMETSGKTQDNRIKGVYCGDLLSWVMSKAEEGNVWITIQSHINVIAVASLVGISAVIMVEGSQVSEEVIEKAQEEDIAIFTSDRPAYEMASLCAEKGI